MPVINEWGDQVLLIMLAVFIASIFAYFNFLVGKYPSMTFVLSFSAMGGMHFTNLYDICSLPFVFFEILVNNQMLGFV